MVCIYITHILNFVTSDSFRGDGTHLCQYCNGSYPGLLFEGLNDAMAERLTPLCVSRSEDWVKDTADKLGILVGRIPAAASHPSWQVRVALVDWASLLLLKCSR